MVRPLDTHADAARRQSAAFRALTPAERLKLADTMSTEVRRLAEAGIRSRRPGASPDDVHEELAELLLGSELASAARRARLARAR